MNFVMSFCLILIGLSSWFSPNTTYLRAGYYLGGICMGMGIVSLIYAILME